MNEKIRSTIINIIGFLICAVWLLPIAWMVVVSIKPESADTTNIFKWLIPPFSLDNIKLVLDNPQADISRWMLNSTLVATLITVGTLALCSFAAFAFSRIDFKGKTIWFMVIMAGLMIPREATLIPLYVLFKDFDMLNTYTSLIVPSIAAPFGLIILKQFFDGIPNALFEAAKIDGCGWFRAMNIIAIPLSKSALASLGIFVFLTGWNDFLWPFISVTDTKIVTVPIGLLVFRSQYLTGQGMMMAASAMMAAPIIIVFVFLEKYIVKGIALTGVKG